MNRLSGEVQQTAHEEHQRDTRLKILLPFGIGAFVLVAGMLLVAASATRGQLSIVADITLMLFMLCPLAVCMLPIALGLVAAAAAMNGVHDWTQLRLDGLIRTSGSVNATINRLMDNLARSAISFGVKTAPLEKKVFSLFDRPKR